MSYGELIKDAFWISWRNKFLWFFGFFVAGTGISSFPFRNAEGLSGPEGLPGPMGWIENNLLAVLLAAALLVLLLFLVFAFLGILSSGGLAESVAAIDRGETRTFSSTFRAGLSSFWRVLLQAILILFIGLGLALIVLLIVGLPFALVFSLTQSTGVRLLAGMLLGLLGFVLFVCVFVPYGIVGQFALRRLVVGREGIATSIGGAFDLFRRNIGRSLLLWVINFGLSIGTWIAMVIVSLVTGLVLFLPAIVLGFAEYSAAAVAAGVIGGLILLPIILVVSGAVGAFLHAYWTLAYLRLSGYERPRAQTA